MAVPWVWPTPLQQLPIDHTVRNWRRCPEVRWQRLAAPMWRCAALAHAAADAARWIDTRTVIA
jgi:hypothetical protein